MRELLAGWLLLVAACGITLPTARTAQPLDPAGHLQVKLTRDGRVYWGERRVTLDELNDLLEAERANEPDEDNNGWGWGPLLRTPVLLTIDRNAAYLHVVFIQYVLASNLAYETWFAVRGGAVYAPLYTGWWKHLADQGAAVNSDQPTMIRLTAEPGGTYTCAGRRTEDPRQLTRWIASERERIGRAHEQECLGLINMASPMRFQRLVTAVDCFRAAGVDKVEWGLVWPHAWVRRQERLPAPHRPFAIGAFGYSPSEYAELSLPLVPTAVRAVDRRAITVNLTAERGVYYRGVVVTLNELGSIVHADRQSHRWRRKQEGLPDDGLAVVLRVHRTAPFLHVQWLLTILREQRIQRIAFAAHRQADLRYTAADAAHWGVERKPWLPIYGLAEDKVTLRMSSTPWEPLPRLRRRLERAHALHVRIARDSSLEEARRRVRNAPAVYLRPAPDAPFELVLAVAAACPGTVAFEPAEPRCRQRRAVHLAPPR